MSSKATKKITTILMLVLIEACSPGKNATEPSVVCIGLNRMLITLDFSDIDIPGDTQPLLTGITPDAVVPAFSLVPLFPIFVPRPDLGPYVRTWDRSFWDAEVQALSEEMFARLRVDFTTAGSIDYNQTRFYYDVPIPVCATSTSTATNGLDDQLPSEPSTFGLPEYSPLDGESQSVAVNDGLDATPVPLELFTDGIPKILNDQCVSKTQLMIVFEFENPVTGEYELFVNDAPYEITPVGGRPERLFFFGAAPPGGGKPTIRLQLLPDHALVLEKTDYSVKQCDFQSPNNNSGGGDGYVVPSPGPGE